MNRASNYTLQNTLIFFALSTAAVLLVGWLVLNGILPLATATTRSPTPFTRFWLQLGLVLGLIVPGIAFLAGIRTAVIRRAFGLYLLVLIVQIVSEMIISRWLFPDIVVVIGTIYTAFRLWQLWQAQTLIAAASQLVSPIRQLCRVILWLLLGFWTINMGLLLTIYWPPLLQ